MDAIANAQEQEGTEAALGFTRTWRKISQIENSSDELGPLQENIAADISQLIGWTPLVEINRIPPKEGALARIIGKLEYFQPLGSLKDRIALTMIQDAEEKGLITPGVSTLIEPTSGNTAISLAFVGIRKGYKVVAVMPDYASVERRMILRAFGAEVYVTDFALGIAGVMSKAEELLAAIPNAHILNQLVNPMNPDAHFRTTGPEIWKDTAGKVDIFIAGSGTGGTVTGAGRYLKQKKSSVKVITVEPSESAVLSGGCKGAHKIQGIGPGFIPDVLDRSVIDEIITVSSEDALIYTRRLAMEEGLLLGISSGAAFVAALKVAKRPENANKMIVTLLPSGGERYMSTELFSSIKDECQNMTF
eukprot:c22695_g1_i1 orf=318-1400(-)